MDKGGVALGFRVILIESIVDMKVKLDNLVIRKEEKDIWIPMDDISMLVIDNLQITLTTRMLCILAMHNVGVVFCNQEHLPIGYYSSYDNHSRISKEIGYQIQRTEEFYQVFWQKIVQAKISNQIQVLEKLDKEENVISHMHEFAEQVRPGDRDNREAHAAKIYFNALMGTSFSRGNEELLINSGLDYGYAIFRSYLAKLCVGYGLNSQLGIHHHNEFNRFNLVDDLIEPFRPFVDYYACQLLDGEEFFRMEHRHKLVNLLNHKIQYKGKKMFLSNAMEEYVSNIAAYIAGKNVEVVFPELELYIGEDDEI